MTMTNDNPSAIVSKVWNYAHVLKNAGVGYGDYVEVRAARALITCQLPQAHPGDAVSSRDKQPNWR